MSENLKLVIVGDSAVGKTTLVTTYGQDVYTKLKITTIADEHVGQIELNGVGIPITIWDTTGKHDLVKVRSLHYNNCEAFVICFDLSDPDSFHNVKNFWIKELRKLGPPGVPIVLCGTKSDLRDQ